jgi:signal peptidase I
VKAERGKPENPKKSQSEVEPLSIRVKKEAIAWFWIVLAFLLINGAVGQARMIPSGSMENTLLIGDHLIMSRIGYDAGIPFTNIHVPLWRSPKRQQIIIFTPPYDPRNDLIKRVIGVPGDLLDIRQGAVWINGQRLREPYTVGKTEPAPPGQAPPGYHEMNFPYRVPDNCYFVMGDNRGNSYDSRFWGCVPRSAILGTPVAIYMSVDAPSEAWNGTLVDRFEAYGEAVIHPDRVRWKRLFETF